MSEQHNHCHEHDSENCCHHHHGQKDYILPRIGLAILLFVVAICGILPKTVSATLFAAAFLTAGADIVWQALKNLAHGEWMDENALISIATIGALAVGEYPEAAMVMILYQSGESLQHRAVEKSRRSIVDLMDIRPDATFREENGKLIKHKPEEIAIGDIIVVKSGEKVPLDGIVTEGSAAADTSALTGESLPRMLNPGSEALSGFINTNGLLKIRVSRTYGESTAAKILELVEHADARKACTEKFITRFARYYTPAVVAVAVMLAVLPPLFLSSADFEVWFKRALTFLVISCPCALVISVPLGFFAGIGGASRQGILIKGSNYLEALACCRTAVLDKTGTLTRGTFAVSRLLPAEGIDEQRLLQTVAAAESISNHPIAVSIRKAAGITEDTCNNDKAEELAGRGIRMQKGKKEILAGNLGLMEEFSVPVPSETVGGGTVVYVAEDRRYLGAIVIADAPKEDAADAVQELKNLGIESVMLTGDTRKAAAPVAAELGIDRFYAGLLPAGKVEKLEELICEKKNGTVIFAGDGINDAPVLTRADTGIAMGGLGSDAAIEAADAVIMDDDPGKVPLAIRIARKTMNIVRQNIVFALGVKALFLVFGTLGTITMWGAVFADVGVALLAIGNSLRALKN